MLPSVVGIGEREVPLAELPAPLPLDDLLPGGGPWEVEIGFGKGKDLLRRAAASPERRFLGVEIASRYYRLVRERSRRRGLSNVLLIRGEALELLAAHLPASWVEAVHVYFPDPWPKARHQKRRLFDVETVDLVVGLLRPGGRLYFATDFLEYGEAVETILASYPILELRRLPGGWPDGPRTNYETKYLEEGRPIVRLEARRLEAAGSLHPGGEVGVLAATAVRGQEEER